MNTGLGNAQSNVAIVGRSQGESDVLKAVCVNPASVPHPIGGDISKLWMKDNGHCRPVSVPPRDAAHHRPVGVEQVHRILDDGIVLLLSQCDDKQQQAGQN